MARRKKAPSKPKYECCPPWYHHHHKHSICFPIFLIIIGLFLYAKDMGMLVALPFWPTVLILFALFMLFKRFGRRE